MKPIICMAAVAAAVAWGQEKASPEPAVKDVELTVYLLSGVQTAGADDVPQDLAAIVRQLHGLFTYKSYKLTESFILLGRQGYAATEGVLPGSGLHYTFSYRRVRLSNEKPYMVHIDGLSISLTGPPVIRDGKVVDRNVIASINTDLDLAEGQKTVVGKSSINAGGDALILVIVPRVIG